MRKKLLVVFFVVLIFSVFVKGFFTKGEALSAIEEGESIVERMTGDGFLVVHPSDLLLEAKRVFKQASYAEILRDKNSSEEEIAEAEKALELVDWKDIYYGNVIDYINEMKKVEKEAYLVRDSLFIIKRRVNKEEDLDINTDFDVLLSPQESPVEDEELIRLLGEAKISFEEERYNESSVLIEELKNYLEKKKSKMATLNAIKENAQNFFIKYWHYILLFVFVFGMVGFFIYFKIKKYLLIKKIKSFRSEKNFLFKLIKKAQEDRFKRNSISGLIYNARVNRYKERINKINEILPVFVARLNKMI